MTKISKTIWAILGIGCLIAVLCGAYWHLATASVCYLFYRANSEEEETI